MFNTFTGFVKVAFKVPDGYSKSSLNVSKCQEMFTDSVKVTCKVPYRYSKCPLNVSKASKCLVPLLVP